jgi:heterodisulfide reductase subunit A
MVTFTIDGKIVEAEEGQTILQVARENNIEIPTLCYHEALEPYGACRLCLVEITAGERKRLITACTYPVEQGIEVRTNSEEIIESRKMSVELLLARCPNVEVIQDLARDFGIEKPRFKLEDDDCILCGLCVRICEERMGVSAISLTGRGINVKVDTPFHIQSDVCMACGACAFICPTGAIKLEDITKHKPIPIPSEFNMGLSSRTPIYIPYPQAVPNIPVIDRENCVHFLTGKCRTCEAFCPTGAINFDQKEDELVELNVASVIIAPGYETVPAAAIGEYGYGRYENVITSQEFERYLSASGPTFGGIIRPSDYKPPKRIAFIQCVGSRDFTSRASEYCCSVGCMYAIKESVIAQEHLPGVEITIFFIDMRTHGKGYENYYVRAEKEYGVRCIRSSVSSVREMKQTKNLRLRYIDETGKNQDEDFDLVVLTVGIQCPSEFGLLSDVVGIERNEYGFCQTDIFSPTNTTRDGIYVCGVIQEPKDIPDSVVQASAAAASASELIAKGRGAMIREKEYPPERGVSNETPRIGVFVCHCGHNIASVVNGIRNSEFGIRNYPTLPTPTPPPTPAPPEEGRGQRGLPSIRCRVETRRIYRFGDSSARTTPYSLFPLTQPPCPPLLRGKGG